mgnify:CR=1 FL=1
MSNSAQTSASSRIASLLDENSFVEVGAYITARNTDFNMAEQETPADGVITGYGTIEDAWFMYTARMHPYWEAPWVRCMQRRSAAFIPWL